MNRTISGKTQKTSRAPTRPVSRTRPGESERVAAKTPRTKPLALASPMKQTAPKKPSAELHWNDQLRDGTHVLIRPITKRDADLEREFIEQLSAEARHMRFFGGIGTPGADFIRRLTDIDYLYDMAFVALIHREGKTQEIGVSRYSTSTEGTFCECAVTVADGWRHRGLATLLMRHLIDTARGRGVRRMVSYDLAANVEMRELADSLGFKRRADPSDATLVIHSLEL